jgi:hypothetical protein
VGIADLAVDGTGDARGARRVGRVDLVDVHAVEDRRGNARGVVGGREPDRARGVDRDLGELVYEVRGGALLEQPVERAQGIVLRVAPRLVDLVHDDHRVGVLAVEEGVEHLAGLGVSPL